VRLRTSSLPAMPAACGRAGEKPRGTMHDDQKWLWEGYGESKSRKCESFGVWFGSLRRRRSHQSQCFLSKGAGEDSGEFIVGVGGVGGGIVSRLAPYHPSGRKKRAAAIKPLLIRSGLYRYSRSNELTTFPRFRVSRRSSTQYVLLLRKSFYSGLFICHTNYGLVIVDLDRLKLPKRSSDETNENGLRNCT
jgi:hypothetical protein